MSRGPHLDAADGGSSAHQESRPFSERIPQPALLHYAALLSGFGTAFLGPSLPALAGSLHLSDRGGGALFAAQFTGAFLGGWSTRAPLRRCMLRGYTCAALGFAALAATLAIHTALLWAVAALLLLGFGVGQIITSNNLLASLLWSHRRGAALTLLNFTWSAGALCSPLFVPALLRAYGPAVILGTFAALLAAGLLAVLATRPASTQAVIAGTSTASSGLSQRTFLFYCLQLFLYGGVETSLDGWLHTYDLRYTHATHAFAASTAAFWFCLAGTRAAASALLLRLPERQFLRAGLVAAIGTLATLLALGNGRGNVIPLLAGLTGAALAPWFPLLFSGLVGEGPTATQAGRIVAVSGLGAAAIPWLVGQVSAGTGSLRTALLLPIAGVLALLLLSLRIAPHRTPDEENASQTHPAEGV
jgi:MFS transporter, FHS family, glucose/mannose:H+ symporter